ncbi:MAG TPA: RNA polymerase sigma factor [Chloroflexota bacterium]|nr:RNA polymerase sigma factor [Chloroflexota bacterium]
MENVVAPEVYWMNGRPADDGRRILERVAARDRDALNELYARYQAVLFRYLYQLAGQRELAEEILQDTLVAVWKSASQFEGRSTVQTWLIGIARRQAHNTLRRRALPGLDVSELEYVATADPEPEDVALARAEREELATAIGKLAPIQREILGLTFVQGLSYREMATILGIPEGTVKSRLNHAKRALRALLEASEEVGR